jgi:hypothetical protein
MGISYNQIYFAQTQNKSNLLENICEPLKLIFLIPSHIAVLASSFHPEQNNFADKRKCVSKTRRTQSVKYTQNIYERSPLCRISISPAHSAHM